MPPLSSKIDASSQTYLRDGQTYSAKTGELVSTPVPAISPPPTGPRPTISAVQTSDQARTVTQDNVTNLNDIRTGLENARQQALAIKAQADQLKAEQDANAAKNQPVSRDSKTSTTVDPLSQKAADTKTAIETANTNIDNQLASINASIDNLYAGNDPTEKGIIQNIKDRYAARALELKQINQQSLGALTVAGLRSGRAQYASEIQDQILSTEERAGQARLTALDAEMQGAVADAQKAYRSGQLQMFNEKMGIIKDIGDRKVGALKDQLSTAVTMENQAIAKQSEKRLQDQQTFAQSNTAATDIAPALASMLTGDPAHDLKVIQDTANEYPGMDVNILGGAVQKYQDDLAAKKAQNVGAFLNEYNGVVALGYKGTPFQYAHEMALQKHIVTPKVSGTGDGSGSSGTVSGLPPNDPIYFVLPTKHTAGEKADFIGPYVQMKKEGLNADAERYLVTKASANLSSTLQKKLVAQADVLYGLDRANEYLKNYAESNPGPWKAFLENKKPLIGLERDSNWTKMKAELGIAQSAMRNELFGANLTDVEKKISNDFLVDFNPTLAGADDVLSALDKLKVLQENTRNRRDNLLQQAGYFADRGTTESSTSIKVKKIGTNKIENYDGTLTPEEAKAAGYEIVP